MSVYSKIIHSLEQRNGSLKKELEKEETEIGFLYLDDDICSKAEVVRYGELKNELQQLMETLAEIKSLEEKKKDLSEDIDKVKTELAGLVAKESGLMLTLGIALYGQSGARSVASFSSSYEEASRYADKIAALKTQAEQMTESLELQNVFNRLVTKVKINSLSVSMNAQQKKLDAVLISGAKAVVEAQDLDESLKCPAYETCISFKNEWNKDRIQLEALQDELQNVEVTLADYGRKSLVQDKVDAKNAEIETFAFQAGHAFDKKYVTRDGEALVEFPAKYQKGLSAVLAIRAGLASVNRRLDILKYSEQIDAADNARESMKKEVAVNEDRIKKLQDQNVGLSRRIDETAAVAESLRAHREAVEKEEGLTLDDLLISGEAAPAGTVEKAADVVKKAASGAEKVAVKAAGTVKKAAKEAGVKKAGVKKEPASDSLDEEAEFLDALNAARASAAAGEKEVQ